MGRTTCALYLSLRYHMLKPDYIYNRVKSLGKLYELRVLLLQVDVKEPHAVISKLTRMCLVADLTLMLVWSSEEAGKLIETYKIYENKPPDLIMEKVEGDDYSRVSISCFFFFFPKINIYLPVNYSWSMLSQLFVLLTKLMQHCCCLHLVH